MADVRECISLVGLRKLSVMKETERPKNWKVLVLNYLENKENFINSHSERNQDHNIDVFTESVELARKMGILWKIRIKY